MTIKLDSPVYNELEEFRDKRETFSQAVARLLIIVNRIRDTLFTQTSATRRKGNDA